MRTDYLNDPTAPRANSLKVAVSAFVQDKAGRILMIHRTDNNFFSLPGGGMEVGETVAGAVIREVAEETGIDVHPTDVIGIFSDPGHVIAYDDGEVRQEFSICFAAEPIGGTARASSESKAVEWVAPDELGDLRIHPSMRQRIDQCLQASGRTYFT
ncbi:MULTISPECIES: NUDIX hydrolase [Nocardia]|uniref:NTP pyrophosphohydrolases containing a Zn-finger, probably nucleic-acid-binding n=1 Tax=Nocardia farcinica TaxID=37329 RepID=A0A0H5P507_NOCFR|nr:MULTISPECIES: NUDIX domain-containing protein [Nocardia]AXK85730.1 NUDIX domain-containing protein [Nocardia farcinica]MBF6070347.1 NUDIX domain-containing protein [Nocardia farcinica]MBF6188649.1 NUDIX domain-containing protein [Nocardia farcinica]MBF6247332.1 NUDIX domain-containing protein [Nocardia elegans]MBF6310895.1 NUDIX domain-containing protein [Nocardia farcinica]